MIQVSISSRIFEYFCSVSNLDLSHIIKWFVANNWVLSLDKMNTMKFVTKNLAYCTLHIGYKENYIEETVNKKFLGLQIDNHINWKNCIEEMIHKLSGTCYAIRTIVHISNINTLKSIYYAYFHSIISMELSSGVILSTVGRFSLYKIKLSELWLVHKPEPLLEIRLKNYRFCLFHASIYLC